MIIRKLLFHIKKILVLAWYRLIYLSSLRVGSSFNFRKDLSIMIGKGAQLSIGDNVFMNNHCSLNVNQKVVIGSNCLFGEGVKIYDNDHRFRNPGTPVADQGFKCEPVSIGDNCWLGSDVIILKGVTIGSNSVIGAGCVITEDLPQGSIVRSKPSSYTIERRR